MNGCDACSLTSSLSWALILAKGKRSPRNAPCNRLHALYSWLLTADPHIRDETLFLTKLDLCRRPPSAVSSREVAPSSSLGIYSVLRSTEQRFSDSTRGREPSPVKLIKILFPPLLERKHIFMNKAALKLWNPCSYWSYSSISALKKPVLLNF